MLHSTSTKRVHTDLQIINAFIVNAFAVYLADMKEVFGLDDFKQLEPSNISAFFHQLLYLHETQSQCYHLSYAKALKVALSTYSVSEARTW